MDANGGVAVMVDIGGSRTATTNGRPRSMILAGAFCLVGLIALALAFSTRPTGYSGGSNEALTIAIAEWERTFNGGDVVGHLDLFNESSVVGGELLKLASHFAADLEWSFEWNPRIELSLCRPAQPRVSSCRFVRTDEFLAPMSLSERGVAEFALDPDDGKLARVDFRVDPLVRAEFAAFYDGFYAWIASNHPEVSITGHVSERDHDTWAAMRDDYLRWSAG